MSPEIVDALLRAMADVFIAATDGTLTVYTDGVGRLIGTSGTFPR